MGYIIRDEMIRPILIGGIICGILSYKASFVPIIDYLNCCCLFDILSGVITARLMTKEFDPSDRDYMIAGGLSGTLVELIYWFLELLHMIIDPNYLRELFMEFYPMELYVGMTGVIYMSIIFIFIIILSIIIGAIFGAVGGILYGKLKRP